MKNRIRNSLKSKKNGNNSPQTYPPSLMKYSFLFPLKKENFKKAKIAPDPNELFNWIKKKTAFRRVNNSM